MKRAYYTLTVFLVSMLTIIFTEKAYADFDISPFFENGKFITGGLDHQGNREDPPVTVFGPEFQEDTYDPYNPADPGVNQAIGIGNLPVGAAVRYNILGSLEYWDGTGEVNFTAPPGTTYITMLMGTAARTLTGTSGTQAGSLIQTVATGGYLHKHFTTSLYSGPGTSNVPGDPGYVAPTDGIYAFSMNLTLTDGGTLYTTDPLWIVWNNGMSEGIHDAAMDHFVPEPASLVLLLTGGLLFFKPRQI
jgi:hypothetical protein